MDLSPGRNYGRSIGNIAAATQVGVFLGPLLGGFIGQAMGYRTVFLAAGLIGVAGLVTTNILTRKISRVPTPSTVARQEKSDSIVKLNFVASLLTGFVIQMAGGVFLALVPIYLVNFVGGINVLEVGIILSITAISQVVVRASLGFLSDRFGRKITILFGLAVAGFAVGVLLYPVSFATMIAVSIMFGLGNALVTPAGAALMTDSVPTQKRTMGMGAYISFVNAGNAVGTTGLGYLAESLGFYFTFGVTSALVFCVAAGLSLLIRRESIVNDGAKSGFRDSGAL